MNYLLWLAQAGTPLPEEAAVEAATDTPAAFWGIIALGLVAILLVAGLQRQRIKRGGKFSATFARVFGLTIIATLGVALTFTSVTSDARAAAFTLLGTIAGYLVGAKVQPEEGSPTSKPPSGGGSPPAGGNPPPDEDETGSPPPQGGASKAVGAAVGAAAGAAAGAMAGAAAAGAASPREEEEGDETEEESEAAEEAAAEPEVEFEDAPAFDDESEEELA